MSVPDVELVRLGVADECEVVPGDLPEADGAGLAHLVGHEAARAVLELVALGVHVVVRLDVVLQRRRLTEHLK